MDWINLSHEIGFEEACYIDIASLCPKHEVRDMCSADKCRVYGKSWSCPPACGSIERCGEKIRSYGGGILLQTVGSIADAFDSEGINSALKLNSRRFSALYRQMKSFYPDCLPLSAGPCTRCLVCTYPSSPCRYPDKAYSSMEAYGLLVSEVCLKNGVPYYRGEKFISFTSCILFTPEEIDK